MTDKTRLKSRPAAAADVLAFYGRPSPYSIKARVIENKDCEVIGIAGYYIIGSVAVMFSDNKESVPALTIWRESKALMQGMKIPAICFGSEKSGPFLKRLGWQYVGSSQDGEVYSWQPF